MIEKNIDNKSRLIFLDCLRIFAFISVLVGHKFYDVLDNLSKDQSIHLTLKVILDVLKTACWGGGGRSNSLFSYIGLHHYSCAENRGYQDISY
jgi:hypothetical protein